MGLLAEIRKFIGKWIKNPIILAGIAYIIFRTLNKYLTEGADLEENIRVVEKDGEYEIIFDTETNSFIVIEKRGKVYPAKSQAHAKNIIKSLKVKKMSSSERLKKIQESWKESLTQKQRIGLDNLISAIKFLNADSNHLDELDGPEIDEIARLQKKQLELAQKISKRLEEENKKRKK